MFTKSVSHNPYFSQIHFLFKTKSWNGWLVYVGHSSGKYFLSVDIREGKVIPMFKQFKYFQDGLCESILWEQLIFGSHVYYYKP